MQDEMVRNSEIPISSVGFSPLGDRGGDATGRLEPLAVPFGRFVAILRRHLWIVVLACLLGTGGAVAVLQRMPKQYTAEASILIEPQRTQVSDLQAISPDAGDITSLVRTQIDVLRSPTLAIGVVKALNLVHDAELTPTGGPLAMLSTLIRRFVLPTTAPGPERRQEDALVSAAAVLSGKIAFSNEPRSSVLKVRVTTQDPALSAPIANEVVRQYLDFKRQAKFAAMQRAHDWFQEQMGGLAGQLRDAELAVDKYRQKYGLQEQEPSDGVGAARTSTVNRQQLDTISRQLVDISRDRARKEAQLAQAQAALRGETPTGALPEVLVSPVIAQLLAQTAVVAGREAQLAAVQGASNPELLAVRSQLRRLQRRTSEEMDNVARSLGTDVKTARAQEQTLQRQLERLRGAVSTENSAQVGLQALQTKARATRSLYESFLNRATQLANVAGIQEPDASLVSTARPPLGPSGPKSVRLLAIAAALSLVLGVALACLIERLRSGFSSPEQLEASLGLPLLALMPRAPRAAIGGIPRGRAGIAFAASLDKLRGQMRALGEGRPRLVMVTSALPREGKTVFAAGLASNAAAAGWRVLLIECDFGCPSIASRFGLPAAPGLREILTGGMLGDSKKAIREPEPRLHVIPAGSAGGDSQELLASNRMSQLLAAVRVRYDLVVLDTPPVLPVADALVLARQADAAMLVVRWEKTARSAAEDALRLLRDSRALVLGAVMTQVDLRTAVRSGGRMSYAFSHYDIYHLARTGRS